jgi:hypothetical protein
MSTLIALFLTFVQLVTVSAGYLRPETGLFDMTITYGSPPAIMLSVLNHQAGDLFSSFYFVLIAIFHVVKYFTMAISQIQSTALALHITSILFEVLYLATAFYFVLQH